MKAAAVILPVLLMIGLGALSKYKHWITPEQKEGASTLVIKVLFPILIFSLMCKVQLAWKDAGILLYIICAYLIIGLIGKYAVPHLAPRFSHFAAYLLMTNEGGNIALPLFLAIVGSSTITVIFDLAVIFVNFVLVPVFVERSLNTKDNPTGLLNHMLHNSFLIAAFLGLLFSITGVYNWLMASSAAHLIDQSFAMLTNAIIPIILFCLGYNMNVSREVWKPILKLGVLRLVLYALVIAGFFVFFPGMMAQKTFLLAVVIYFMSPTSFGLIPSIVPLYRTKDDAAFASSFTSAYMLVTILVFIGAVLYAG